MGTKQVKYDDLNDEDGAETVKFSINGAAYEVDLVKSNYDKLMEGLEPFIAVARSRGGVSTNKRQTRTRARGMQSSADMQAVREWAKKKGYNISPRGRIPREVMEAFEAEHEPNDSTLASA